MRNMLLADAGLVINPPNAYGRAQVPGHRDLYRRILRTPHNVVPERRPDLVSWGRVRIDANGRVAPLDGAVDDALTTLEKAGPRKAALVGVVAGLVFGGGRLFGALTGGALGYISGTYLIGVVKKLLAAQQVAAVVPKAEGK